MQIIKFNMGFTKDNQKVWQDFYQKSGKFLYWPAEELVAFCHYNFNKEDLSSKTVLDVACGAGRNLLFFGKSGARIYGLDASSEAISEAQIFLNREGLNPHLTLGESTSMPYPDSFFDITVLWGLFHYLSPRDQEKTKEEVRRVTKNNGQIIFTLRSVNDSDYGLGKLVRKDTFVQDKPGKKDIYFQYWNEQDAWNFFDLENRLMGEKVRVPIGAIHRIKNVHWLIAGRVKK